MLAGSREFFTGSGYVLRGFRNLLDDLVQTVFHEVERGDGFADFVGGFDVHIGDG